MITNTLTITGISTLVRHTPNDFAASMNLIVSDQAQLVLIDILTEPLDALTISIDLGQYASCTFLTIMKLEKQNITYKVNVTTQEGVESSFICLQHLKNSKVLIHNNYHASGGSTTDFRQYALLDEASHIEIEGNLVIPQNSINASCKQYSSILMLDTTSRGITKPFLEIACHDVLAQHGSALGCLSLEELWYAAARGLSSPILKDLMRDNFLRDHIKRQQLPYHIENLIYEYL